MSFFRTRADGIRVIKLTGGSSIYYGDFSNGSNLPAGASSGDYAHDVSNGKVYSYNGTSWAETGFSVSIQQEVDNIETAVGLNADGTFSSFVGTNYVDTSTTVKNAIELLDSQLAVVQRALNPRGFAVAITGDTVNFGSGVTGPVAGATQPSDYDGGTDFVVDKSVQNGDQLFCTDGTVWDYDSVNAQWVKNTSITHQANDLWLFRYDLPDSPAGQELAAQYFYDGTQFVKYGEVSNDIASAINLTTPYVAAPGTVSATDTVQSAIQKLDGNIQDGAYTRVSFAGVTTSQSVSATSRTAKFLVSVIDATIPSNSYTSEVLVATDGNASGTADAAESSILITGTNPVTSVAGSADASGNATITISVSTSSNVVVKYINIE